MTGRSIVKVEQLKGRENYCLKFFKEFFSFKCNFQACVLSKIFRLVPQNFKYSGPMLGSFTHTLQVPAFFAIGRVVVFGLVIVLILAGGGLD